MDENSEIYSKVFTDVSQYVLGLKEIEHLFPDAVQVQTPKVEKVVDPQRKKVHDLLDKISNENGD
jgi:hypothetical protein